MVLYDNELKTKENKNWTKNKIEPQQVYISFYHRGWSVLILIEYL